MSKSNLPAKVETSTALATNSASDFSDFAGLGMESVKSTDILVPRLGVLQALSPQISSRKPEYIPGAEEGNIADLGVGEVFPEGVIFLPVLYRKDYLEWAPRSTGKGLQAIHSDPSILDQCSPDERNRPILPNGNLISETAQFFGLNLSANGRPCFIPMSGTQLKVARKWMLTATSEKLMRSDGSQFLAPLFYRTYQLTTVATSNNDGEWFLWKVAPHLALPDLPAEGGDWRGVKEMALRFIDQLSAGELKADHQRDEAVESNNEGAM